MSIQDSHSHLEVENSTLEEDQGRSNQDLLNRENTKKLHWIELHFPIILYTWFWFGLILCAVFTPEERVLMLKSQVITKGWDLILVSVILSTPIFWMYWKRVSKNKKS